MAPANNNAKAKAEPEKEALRNQRILNERKKEENETKKSTTMRTLTRNTLVRNLANLKEPALDPLRDAIMSLSDPSFLNKKFNEDVYRGLPLRVKDFIGLSANQVTRAVIINKIIEAVKIAKNKKAKNVGNNKSLANTLVKVVSEMNSNTSGVTRANNIIKQITELKNKLNRAQQNAKTSNVAKKEVNNLVASLVKMTRELENIKTTLETKLSAVRNEVKTLQKGSGSSENNSRLKIAEIALKTQQNKVNELEKLLKNLQTAKITPKSAWMINKNTSKKATTGTNATPVSPKPENNVLEIKITPTPTNNQMMSIYLNNFNPNAKQLQLTLPNNIKPDNVINRTVNLLKSIPINNKQLNSFVLALEQPRNNNTVNITNSNTPNSQTMARIFKNYIYGNPISRPEIIYLEKGLTKIVEDAKKNNNKSLALTWETQTNAKTKSGKNVSLQDWIGAVAKSDESGSTKSKPIGIFKGLFVGLTAAAVRVIITSRKAATKPAMFSNPLSNNQQSNNQQEMFVNPLAG